MAGKTVQSNRPAEADSIEILQDWSIGEANLIVYAFLIAFADLIAYAFFIGVRQFNNIRQWRVNFLEKCDPNGYFSPVYFLNSRVR